MEIDLVAVHHQLVQRGIHVNHVWLEQCVDYIEETASVTTSTSTTTASTATSNTCTTTTPTTAIATTVAAHFMQSDIRVSRADQPRLPLPATQPEVASCILDNIILQVLDMTDVGIPALRLLDNITPSASGSGRVGIDDTTGVSEESGNGDSVVISNNGRVPRGMLKLTLTDGHRVIFGMEYKPLPDLHVDMEMGFKIRVKNAIVVRGIILLTPQCIEILGGCADDDTIVTVSRISSLVSKLRRHLNLPESSTVAESSANESNLHIDRYAQRFLILPPTVEDIYLDSHLNTRTVVIRQTNGSFILS